MYRIVPTGKFKKDLKLLIKRGYNMKLMDDIVTKLSNGEKLPEKNKDHALTRTGTHSDLFK